MRRGRRGNTIMEAALLIPFATLLIVGTVQVGKITYMYYTLKKTLYTLARYLATQQAVNFCDTGDPTIASAISYALTGTLDNSVDPFIANLTPDMIQVQTECYDPNSQSVGACISDSCGTAAGGQRPDFVVVSIPNGYQVQPRIPFLLLDPIPLKPEVRVPFEGTQQ